MLKVAGDLCQPPAKFENPVCITLRCPVLCYVANLVPIMHQAANFGTIMHITQKPFATPVEPPPPRNYNYPFCWEVWILSKTKQHIVTYQFYGSQCFLHVSCCCCFEATCPSLLKKDQQQEKIAYIFKKLYFYHQADSSMPGNSTTVIKNRSVNANLYLSRML